jgi:hypothetical protein
MHGLFRFCQGKIAVNTATSKLIKQSLAVFKLSSLRFPALFALHTRLNFLYISRVEISDQSGKLKQVFDPGYGLPPREDHKGISFRDVGPVCWKIGQLPIPRVIKDPPLPPAPAAIHKLELLPAAI